MLIQIAKPNVDDGPVASNIPNEAKGHLAERYVEGHIGGIRREAANSTKFYSNLIATEPAEQPASVLGNTQVTPEIAQICKVLAFRFFAATDGNIVLSSGTEEIVRDFSTYLEKQGFVSPGASSRVCYVRDTGSIRSSLQEIKDKLGESASIVPYSLTEDLGKISTAVGVGLHGYSQSVGTLVTLYNNKVVLRNLVEELGLRPSYPRCSIKHDPSAPELSTEDKEALSRTIKYSDEYKTKQSTGDAQPALFVQKAQSGGGFGNFVVTRLGDDSYTVVRSTGDQILDKASYTNFCRWLNVCRKQDDIDIAPYLKIDPSAAYSYGVVALNDAVIILGRRHQVLTPLKEYDGFRLDVSDPAGLTTADDEARFGLKLASHLHSKGFRGPFSIDYFCYQDENRVVRLGVSELNVRLDATTPLTDLCLLHSASRDRLATGTLSIRQDDHVRIPLVLGRSTGELVENAVKAGIPLASATKPEGVIFMTPIVPNGDSSMVMVGYLGETDRKRDDIRDNFLRFAQNNKHSRVSE